MNHATRPEMTPPSLSELMQGYLRQTEGADLSTLAEVETYDASVGYRVDARMAWAEGLNVFPLFGLTAPAINPPADWSSLVGRGELLAAVSALPVAVGNFPQRVRDLASLLEQEDLASLVQQAPSLPAPSSVRTWARTQEAAGVLNALVAVGVLRLLGDLTAAEELLSRLRKVATAAQLTLVESEQAALFWQQGKLETALAIWRELGDCPGVRFNRGMAALFSGEKAEARAALRQVMDCLPDNSSWHHLAGLYLALAEM